MTNCNETCENLIEILIVEDNEDDYEAMIRSFRKNNFMNPMHWSRDGQDALDYIHKTGAYSTRKGSPMPGLILLDLNMPGLDGRAVLKALKEEDKTKPIPVIILTTSSDNRDVLDCYKLGASTYIQKPVNFEGLTTAVAAMKDYWLGLALLPDITE